MVTRRVRGPFYVRCPYCPAQYGPFARLSMGNWTCSRCGKTFKVR